MKSFVETKEDAESNRKWMVVDAAGQTVGRLASQVASILRGKHSPKFTPHVDCGDFVVVVNAEKIEFTGAKWSDKVYYRHTGYVGSVKEESAARLRQRKPEEVILRAVRGMLPKTTLGRHQLQKLKVYKGAEHPHAAQKPQTAPGELIELR